MAEKVVTGWVVQNTTDDYLGDKVVGVYFFRTERDAKGAAANAGPSFVPRRVRLNGGNVKNG